MTDKDKKTDEIEEKLQEEPKVEISSFSLIDAPKPEVKAISEEELKEPADAIISDPKTEADEEHQELPAAEEKEPKEEKMPLDKKIEPKKGSLSSEEVKKWLKDVRPDTTKEVEKKAGPSFRLMFMLLLAFLLIGAVVGGVFYYKSKVSKKPAENEKAEEVLPTKPPSAEPSAEVKLDLSKYSVNILNGSGIPGEAGKVGEELKELEFKEIKTANADSYDYTTTTVSLKEELPDEVYQAIAEVLSKNYNPEKDKTALEKNSSYDIVITVGTKK